MFSGITLQARKYYAAQADLDYIDSLSKNVSQTDAALSFNANVTAQAEKAKNNLSVATDEINKLGGAVKGGNVYDGKDQVIRSHITLGA